MKIGPVNVENGLLLAPMEGVTDLPFRIICKRMGADIVYSEFIAADALVRDIRRSKEKMIIVDEERPVAVQIFGGNVDAMVDAAKMVQDTGADILDINFGCWVKKVVNHNAGAAYLKDPLRLVKTAEAIAKAVDMPVTCKTRYGWDSDSIVIEEVARMLNDTGIKALSVHCRTRSMGMSGEADWSLIPRIKEIANYPVILNGDIKTPEDARRGFEETGADAVMIGRAAIGNPFLFMRSKAFMDTGVDPGEPDFEAKIGTCIDHLDLTIKYKGFPRGLYEFRKHYTGYLKGYFLASKVRQQLVVTESYEEVIDILNRYRELLIERRDSFEPLSEEDSPVSPEDNGNAEDLSCPGTI